MKQYRTGPQTPRLMLRALTLHDAPELFALNSNPFVMQHTGESPMTSIDDAVEAITGYRDFESVGFGRWGCILKESNSLIGFCGLKYLPEFDAVDVGYRLLPEFWGRGLATEACCASVAFGFEVLRLNQILAFVLPANQKSISVLRKAGLTEDGIVDYDGITAIRYTITSDQFDRLLNSKGNK